MKITDTNRLNFIDEYLFEFKPKWYDGGSSNRIIISTLESNTDNFLEYLDNYIEKEVINKNFYLTFSSSNLDTEHSKYLKYILDNINYYTSENGPYKQLKYSYFYLEVETSISDLFELCKSKVK